MALQSLNFTCECCGKVVAKDIDLALPLLQQSPLKEIKIWTISSVVSHFVLGDCLASCLTKIDSVFAGKA